MGDGVIELVETGWFMEVNCTGWEAFQGRTSLVVGDKRIKA